MCVNSQQQIFYFNDNDKNIYKKNLNGDTIENKSLETKDNKYEIGDAKRLILTTPDNKYLVLGTSTGQVFVILSETL